MNYGDLTWEESLIESQKRYYTDGPRSNKKLIPPHQWIKETLKKHLGDDYEFYAKGENNTKYDKEYKVPGKLYEKIEDITIIKNEKILGVVSFKFVGSNYKQNKNNYFENLIGECFNIQSAGIPFCYVFVLKEKIPYFNQDKTFKKYEHLNAQDFFKYIKLNSLDENDAVPKKMSLMIMDVFSKDNKIIHPTVFNQLSDEVKIYTLNNIQVQKSEYSKYGEEIAILLNEMEIHKVLKEFADIIKENEE